MEKNLLYFPTAASPRRRNVLDMCADTLLWPIGAGFNARACRREGLQRHAAAFGVTLGFCVLALGSLLLDLPKPRMAWAICAYAAGMVMYGDVVQRFRGYFIIAPRE